MTRMACWHGFVRALTTAAQGLAVSLLLLQPLLAAEAAKAAEDDDLADVVVTGSRIQVPGATSANPIESISAEEMRNLGIVNVADALLQLVPQNISQYQPGLVGDIQTSQCGRAGQHRHRLRQRHAGQQRCRPRFVLHRPTPSRTCAAWIRCSARAH